MVKGGALKAPDVDVIFGLLGVVNFAHGSFYMLGAFLTYQFMPMLMPGTVVGFALAVLFAALSVAFSAALGLLLAVLLNWESLRGRGVYRLLLFLPYAVTSFISILIFKGLFNQNLGEINLILNGLFGIKPQWFADHVNAGKDPGLLAI